MSMEKHLLGVSHNKLAAWLMQTWKMPEKLIMAEEHHHNLDYHSVHADYALLANLSERPLEMHDMYDADNGDIPPELLEPRDL